MRTAGGRTTYCEMYRHVHHICFLLDLLLQLLLNLLLLSRSAHRHAVRPRIPHPLRPARVPTIELPSRGFSCRCSSQPRQGYHPHCVQLGLHHRKVPTMVVQQPSLQHFPWVAIVPHRTLLVPRARIPVVMSTSSSSVWPWSNIQPLKLHRSLFFASSKVFVSPV